MIGASEAALVRARRLDREGDALIAASLGGRRTGRGRRLGGLGAGNLVASERRFTNRLSVASVEDAAGFARTMPLALAEAADALARARLTERQRSVALRRAGGQSLEEIAREDGTTKQGAFNLHAEARRRLDLAAESLPSSGMWQAYREDVGRGRGRR